MQGWDDIKDKLDGAEEHGDPSDNTNAWVLKYNEEDVINLKIWSGDKSHSKEYDGNDLIEFAADL